MKTTIGGDRLGSGSKQEVSIKNYNRSTHDLSYIWRSSMSAGTLVPFLNELALPGDTFDINLNCDVKTLPTVGPLFGSYKVQLDVFEAPIRLYQGKLHMNMINIGMNMAEIKIPQLGMYGTYDPAVADKDNMFINPSSIFSYLNIRGLGRTSNGAKKDVYREFNAVPYLAYWEIYKNYYSNKMESDDKDEAQGAVIHAQEPVNTYQVDVFAINGYGATPTGTGSIVPPASGSSVNIGPIGGVLNYASDGWAQVSWPHTYAEYGSPDPSTFLINFSGGSGNLPLIAPLTQIFQTVNVQAQGNGTYLITFSNVDPIFTGTPNSVGLGMPAEGLGNTVPEGLGFPEVRKFPLKHIDEMREKILQNVASPNAVIVDYQDASPYGWALNSVDGVDNDDKENMFMKYGQEGLALKTYQSDLFNNWLDNEWIEGPNGVGEVSAVVVQQNQAGTEDVVYMDSLNLQQKVYNMLNRIAVSGGSYDDWLDAVYTHERAKGVESPIYHGSLIKELSFQEVVSNSDTELEVNGQLQQSPLGTLAGRGKLSAKHKGGRMKIKVQEPSFLIGIVSITPRIDYSQGNHWTCNLKTMNDFYKPELGAIGYQDLDSSQLHWAGDIVNNQGDVTTEAVGKQPAWINYMTNVNRTRGNFAVQNNSMFMTLNRRYEVDETTGKPNDITTYIDPSKFNFIFAQTELDSQNFWTQVGCNITARRKMTAKVIPNL